MRRHAKYLIIIVIILLISCTLFYYNNGAGLQADYSRLAEIQVKLKEKMKNSRDRKLESKWRVSSILKEPALHVQLDDGRTSTVDRLNDAIVNDKRMTRVQNVPGVKTERVSGNGSMKRRLALLNDDKALKRVATIQGKPGVPAENNVQSFHAEEDVGESDEMEYERDTSVMGNHNGGKTKDVQEHESHFHIKKENINGHLNRSVSLIQQSLHLHDNKVVNERDYFVDRFRLKVPCSDPLCTGLLSDRDTVNFTTCKRRTETTYNKMLAKMDPYPFPSNYSLGVWGSSNLTVHMRNGHLLPSGECRFMNGSGRSPVGLVSFPGSGNTWVRGLLQKATGICTGAVYCDRTLRMGGFDGEGVQGGSVLVVKTHSSVPMWSKVKGQLAYDLKGRPHFDSALLIVRNPFDALVSEWNRELSTKYGLGRGNRLAHTNTYGQEYFLTYSDWTKFVDHRVTRWKIHFDWLFKCPDDHDIIVVKYEDIKSDVVYQVERMLKFLHFPYNYAELSTKLSKDFAVFHRRNKQSFDHFTIKQKELVNVVIHSVVERLNEVTGRTFGIEDYIMK